MATDTDLVAARQYGASASDLNLLSAFKSRVADFRAARAELQKFGASLARSTNDERTLLDYGKLVARGDTIENAISAATRAIDSALKTARAALGLDGVRYLAGLGLVWLLPVAVIAAAVAAMGYWISDYLALAQRYNAQQRIAQELVAQGVAPVEAQRQASNAVAAAAPQAFGEAIAGVAKFALILGVGFFAWKAWRARG